MTTLARRNGWRGFDNLAERVDGGWEYRCDGYNPPGRSWPYCGALVTVPRRWTKVGPKRASGWLVCYGRDEGAGDDGKGNDVDVVLTFCPSCAVVVREQDARTPR